jgi:hypothetical protein
MEFSIPPQLLLIISSAVVLIGALGIRIVGDARAISRTNALNRQLIKASRARLKTGVSVIIELGRKADSIMPLLDHLSDQSYKKLETIIVIKQTAGKNARPALNHYKRAHPELHIRLVSFKAGLTLHEIVRRFSTKPLVITLSADQTLSRHFFSHISVDYALEHPDRIIPRHFGKLDNRLRTAFTANTMRNSLHAAATSQKILPGIIYKRASLLRAPKVERIEFSPSAYIVTPAPSTKSSLLAGLSTIRLRWFNVLTLIVAVLGLIYVSISLEPSDRLALLGLIIGVYALMYITNLIGLKAYSLVEKISLALLSPIFMLYQVLSYSWSSVLALSRIPKRFYDFSRQLLPRKKYS